MSTGIVAEVIVETGGGNLHKPFSYLVPESLDGKVRIGTRVKVPLGKRKVTGFVVGWGAEKTEMELKEIHGLVDEKPVFSTEQLQIARWMSAYYLCRPYRALQCVSQAAMHKTKAPRLTYYYINFPGEQLEDNVRRLGRAVKQASVLEAAAANPGLTKKELSVCSGASFQVIDLVVKKGFLRVTERILERDPWSEYKQKRVLPRLSGEQERAVEEIKAAVNDGMYSVFLLYGVTGSGKTEVYLRSIAHTLGAGRGAIVLVPEISLTPQMIKSFKERFGRQVAVLHSRMSQGERYDQWERLSRGEARIALGARSAVFAPVNDPGIIIVDEEHEFTYKQEENPRYHARAVALYRAHLNKGIAVLGSATPSLESFCRAETDGPYHLLQMTERIDNRPMPVIETVDMRREFRSGNRGIFSRKMIHAVAERLEQGEQIILFLNRRGFNTFVVCRECGLVMKCPHCDISLTYHWQGKLRCHYCGYSQMAPGLCPDCRSPHISYLGTGTQKIEEEVTRQFPGARVLRMDADTTGRKGAHQKILDSFAGGGADILIGTQMVAKGLNLPGVTLVGVVSADTGLYMPDFRASERAFQLITQVSGRSGRANIPGEVIIQTYNPDHYAISAAASGDFLGFFGKEMKIRRQLQYPPFSKMGRIIVSGREENKVVQTAEKAFSVVEGFLGDNKSVMAVGPAPAPLSRVRGNYRVHVVLWSKEETLLRDALKRAEAEGRKAGTGKQVRLSVDIDPYNMM